MPMPKYARVLLTSLTYVVALGVVGCVALVSALVLAGPHGSILPNWATGPFLMLMWGVILVVPVLLAHSVWTRLARRGAPPSPSR
jgi:hypothetical protein